MRNKSSKDRNKTISHIGLKTTLGQVNIDAKKPWEHCAKIVYKWYQGKPIQVLMIGYIYIYILSLSPNLYPDDRKHQAIQVLIV